MDAYYIKPVHHYISECLTGHLLYQGLVPFRFTYKETHTWLSLTQNVLLYNML